MGRTGQSQEPRSDSSRPSVPTIDEALNPPPEGDNWWDITADALDVETYNVESALDKVLEYVNGQYRNEYLAPEVNTGGPAPAEGFVEPTS